MISEAYNPDERAIILLAMEELKSHSCLQWIPREAGNPDQQNFVHILKGDGCHSPIGRQQSSGQVLSLGNKFKFIKKLKVLSLGNIFELIQKLKVK